MLNTQLVTLSVSTPRKVYVVMHTIISSVYMCNVQDGDAVSVLEIVRGGHILSVNP